MSSSYSVGGVGSPSGVKRLGPQFLGSRQHCIHSNPRPAFPATLSSAYLASRGAWCGVHAQCTLMGPQASWPPEPECVSWERCKLGEGCWGRGTSVARQRPFGPPHSAQALSFHLSVSLPSCPCLLWFPIFSVSFIFKVSFWWFVSRFYLTYTPFLFIFETGSP